MRSGFTLVELLVVIGLTAVLFFLLLRPLIDSFNLTKRVQMLTAAQDSARKTLEILTRELGSAVYVFDNDSHPFTQDTPSAALPNDQFSNFLNLEITNQSGNVVLAHAYNAKLDMVLARHQLEGTAGTRIDPTTGLPIKLNTPTSGSSATLNGTGLIFPSAPGSTVIRDFVGLKDPSKPYSNRNEGHFSANGNGTNTYVLYRVQFAPYNSDGTPNTSLFATTTKQVNGQTANIVEFDDPDFFRYVQATDINWLDPSHAAYGSSGMAAHNTRVDNWVKLAKPIINAPDIDLILLPHNRDNTLAYDQTGEFTGIAHSGAVHDPVANATPDPATGNSDWPVINTSITFRPATVTGDASPGTTASYASQGVPADAADNGGLPYIPTVFTATSKSWAYPYTVSLYPSNYGTGSGQDSVSYATTVAPTASSTAGMYMDPGDVIEAMYTSPTDTSGTPVYNVTLGQSLGGTHTYVPMAINADTGTINFDQPALPNGPSDKFTRFWVLPSAAVDAGTAPGETSPGVIDLTKLPSTPLGPTDGSAPSGYQVSNAVIVPGSVRVYGPDASQGTNGPNMGVGVLYTPVGPGDPLGPNQYEINYAAGAITLGSQLPTTKDAPAGAAPPAADPVQIAFDYQSNLTAADTTKVISATNPASPMLVKVDYQTRDLIDVNVGVRVFDPADGGVAQIVNVSNKIQVGNTNR